ncbi:hypothetical protein AK812_SmicGene43476 [Symbiodinium microadriaticum]|uniref:Uncharacterized protein n=1 Tax=Symbiodinium microadriaticum TaxID=2951 RepID=A0A1Q9C0X9_SYMMI|nr:hypothetical protein AK812_SmicGene43476 [Symbiodinium microadriaticum]
MDSEILKRCQVLLHCKAIDIPRFKEIWSDNTQLRFASTMNSRDWVPPDRLCTMEEQTKRNDDGRRSGRIWQNFEVSLRIPAAVYCPEQYWFMIDEYCAASLAGAGANGRVFFCHGCENQKEESRFCQESTTFSPVNAYPERCIGCAFKHAHHASYYNVKNYGDLRESESYSLARAYHIYVNDLQDVRPSDDLKELLRRLRRCCPIAYKAVGKVVSAYGGIRSTPEYALVYPIWGRTKQLSWDRAYGQAGHLCFIAYYDAGNAAYAGFIKTLLSPQERIELFRGNENPHEDLLGGVFELTLGFLILAIRFPGLFDRWGDVDTVNACINGFEKCFIRYSARESITLITARTPKKRKPAKADPEIEKEVQEILKALPSSRFLAVPASITLQPTLGVTGSEARGVEDTYFDSSQGVEVPRLVPDDSVDPDGQPDEEEIADKPQDLNIANAAKAKAWDALNMLFNGNIWVLRRLLDHNVERERQDFVRRCASQVTEESSDGTTIGHNMDTRILDTIAFPTVTTVAFLRSFPQKKHNSVIQHGTTLPPNEYTWFAKDAAKTALRFIQKDLRHHIGREDRGIYLRNSPIPTILCDEGGWVKLDWNKVTCSRSGSDQRTPMVTLFIVDLIREGRADTSMEIPRQEIACAPEEADAIPVEDDNMIMEDEPQPEVDNDGDARMDNEDARTVAEPEMEIDVDEAEGEEHAAEAKEMFDDGKRHDALGPWGHLSEAKYTAKLTRARQAGANIYQGPPGFLRQDSADDNGSFYDRLELEVQPRMAVVELNLNKDTCLPFRWLVAPAAANYFERMWAVEMSDDNVPRLTSPSAIVDRKLGAQKAANLRPADKMFIIDSVRDRELPGQHIRHYTLRKALLAKVSFDGTSLQKVSIEGYKFYSHGARLGAYGPPLASRSALDSPCY